MDSLSLLDRHNPILIIFPDDPRRQRPGALFDGSEGRGDYHPCAAEFFLSLVTWRPRPKPWLEDLAFWKPRPALVGLDRLKELALAADRAETLQWEIDVQAIRSQQGGQAWKAYGEILASSGEAARPVVYGHVVEGAKPVLQYWYLYVYNDAVNDHEGDWESVAVELDGNGAPILAGFSGHEGGVKRDWDRVQKEGDHPLVYVARGSHAAYFQHLAAGHRTNSIAYPKNLPPSTPPSVPSSTSSAASANCATIRPGTRTTSPCPPSAAAWPSLPRCNYSRGPPPRTPRAPGGCGALTVRALALSVGPPRTPRAPGGCGSAAAGVRPTSASAAPSPPSPPGRRARSGGTPGPG